MLQHALGAYVPECVGSSTAGGPATTRMGHHVEQADRHPSPKAATDPPRAAKDQTQTVANPAEYHPPITAHKPKACSHGSCRIIQCSKYNKLTFFNKSIVVCVLNYA